MWLVLLLAALFITGVAAAFWFTRDTTPPRHRKKSLRRQIALNRLEDAMGRTQQQDSSSVDGGAA